MRPSTLCSFALLLGCSGAPTEAPPPPGPPTVCALSTPVGWLASEIGAGDVALRLFNPPGEDPPAWRPSPEAIASLAACDLILAHGAGYEAWLATATVPESRLVRTAEPLATLQSPGLTHRHGERGEHAHGGVDPHTWSDPQRFASQAAAVRDALTALDPAHAEAYRARAHDLEQRLQALHTQLEAALAPLRGQRLAANHPAWRYLAERYALDLTSFHLEPDEPPAATELEAVSAWLTTAGPAPVLWWESEPSEAVRAALPPALRHLRVDPLEQPPADRAYDYLAQQQANADRLRAIATPAPQ
jgi:zinc transport system substrate-binding protein